MSSRTLIIKTNKSSLFSCFFQKQSGVKNHMKMLTCKAMGGDDDFFAKGKTEEEVMSKMMNHVKEKHPEKMDEMGEEKVKEMMKKNMTDDM